MFILISFLIRDPYEFLYGFFRWDIPDYWPQNKKFILILQIENQYS